MGALLPSHDSLAGMTNVFLDSINAQKGPLLLDLDSGENTPHARAGQHGDSDDEPEDPEGIEDDNNYISMLFELQVHPDTLAALLARAAAPEARQAMQHGDSLLPWASHRLLLSESRAAERSSYRRGPAGQSDAWAELYDEAREWWMDEGML